MALETPKDAALGMRAPDFRLPATDGRTLSFDDVAGPRGTLILFICNHCPYVKATLDRMIRDARDLTALGVGTAAICSNDAETHPEDGFEAMTALVEAKDFPFPYLHDADQSVARAYGAVCTPDPFGFDATRTLQYRGRIDASGPRPAPEDARRELFEAMVGIAETGRGPSEQIPSMGCSIKWKAA